MDSKAAMKRKLILQATKELMLKTNVHTLTLDAVAKEAGISKGGLLYHFPSKEALLGGVAEFIFEEFMLVFEEQAKQDPVDKGRWSRALIQASHWDLEQNAALNVGIVAGSMLNPNLCSSSSIAKSYQFIQQKVEQDGLPPATATIIRLAIDGLYYSELYDTAPLERPLKDKVFAQLLSMTR